jgi:SAM-dependent methyltransferase
MTSRSDKKINIQTYNKTAQAHAKKFDGIGPRVEEIKRVFSYLDKPNPNVLELGCGNGRDARVIIPKANNYLGLDISTELIKIARATVPTARFKVKDFESTNYPSNLDIIFSFASLLHVDKQGVKKILNKAVNSLNQGGLFYLSTKHGSYRREKIAKEGHGPKVYFFYDLITFQKIMPSNFKIVFHEVEVFNGQKWIHILLQKQP